MIYLLDGYNLAHWLAGDGVDDVDDVDDDDLAPDGLRRLLVGALHGRLPPDAEAVRIFWDVRRPSPSVPANAYLGWCTMHNVPDADVAIIDAVHDAPRPRECVVVSRDREVTGRSRQLGARTMSPAELLGRR